MQENSCNGCFISGSRNLSHFRCRLIKKRTCGYWKWHRLGERTHCFRGKGTSPLHLSCVRGKDNCLEDVAANAKRRRREIKFTQVCGNSSKDFLQSWSWQKFFSRKVCSITKFNFKGELTQGVVSTFWFRGHGEIPPRENEVENDLKTNSLQQKQFASDRGSWNSGHYPQVYRGVPYVFC